ncbi:MAG: P-II family nitrogen regulator [Methanoregula sp.]|jgi:nitrogen regulatory protein PII 2
MKQIIAIIRDEKIEDTKEALKAVGISGVTFLYVTGRGQQKGRVSAGETGRYLNLNLRKPFTSSRNDRKESDDGNEAAGLPNGPDTDLIFGFLPKRMLIIVADNEEVSRIVQAIVNVNQTGRHGDGRIFICPMIGAIRIRTGEQGDMALS